MLGGYTIEVRPGETGYTITMRLIAPTGPQLSQFVVKTKEELAKRVPEEYEKMWPGELARQDARVKAKQRNG